MWFLWMIRETKANGIKETNALFRVNDYTVITSPLERLLITEIELIKAQLDYTQIGH